MIINATQVLLHKRKYQMIINATQVLLHKEQSNDYQCITSTCS